MKASFILFSLLAFGWGLYAQPGMGPHARHQEPDPAIKAYLETNVLPVMSQQRAELELLLTEAEKAEIQEIRAGLQALRAQRMEQRRAHRETMDQGRGERPRLTEAQRQAMQEHRTAHRRLMTRAWAIVDAHEADFNALFDEIADERETWRTDLHELRAEARAEGRRGQGPRQHGPRAQGNRGAGPGHRGPGGQGPAFLQPVHFLLWDGQSLPFKQGEGEALNETAFPNPASDLQHFRYRVQTAGQVTINLLDESGKLVERLKQENQHPAGTFTLDVDLSRLEPGVYYYQLISPEGKRTKRILKP